MKIVIDYHKNSVEGTIIPLKASFFNDKDQTSMDQKLEINPKLDE